VFYRNGVNLGLPVVVVESVEGIATGDELVVDLALRAVRHPASDRLMQVKNLGGIALEILSAGGIVAYTLERARTRGTRRDAAPASSSEAVKR
jgi:3-isopropylmalate dehydratase small subunit